MTKKDTRSAIVEAAESVVDSILSERNALPVEIAGGRRDVLPYIASPAALKILVTASNESEVDAYFSNLPISQLVTEINEDEVPRWVKMSRVAALGAFQGWVEKKALRGEMDSEMLSKSKMIKHNDEFAFNAGKNLLNRCYENIAA